MNERVAQLFDQVIAGGLSDVAGAEASVTLPISKRLLNDLVSAALPPSAPVQNLEITPLDGDRFLVGGRIGSSSLLPPFQLNVAIDRQPEFPAFPFLVLRLESAGLRLLAGLVLRKISMPPWIESEFDRIRVNLRALADQNGVGQYIAYIEQLQVKTIAGSLQLSVRARVP